MGVTKQSSLSILGLRLTFLLSLASSFHDLFTFAVALVDVISDVLVAKQFYDEGHNVWGNLVTGSIALSSIVLAFLGAVSIRQGRYLTGFRRPKRRLNIACNVCFGLYDAIAKKPKWLRFIIFLPVAQLLPIAHFILEYVYANAVRTLKKEAPNEELDNGETIDSLEDFQDPVDDDTSMGTRQASDLLNEEEESKRAKEHAVMGSFQKGFKTHMKAHSMFYVETCVESIPQCIIQLLAMSFLEEASPLQLLSMVLSLISIISKAYLLSISFDLKIIVWRFALAAHDVVGLFYIFSTLLSPSEPREWQLPSWMCFGGDDAIAVSWISYLMCLQIAFVAAFTLLCGLCFIAVVLCDEFKAISRRTWKNFLETGSIICFMFVLYIPIVFGVETIKFSLLSLGLMTQKSSSYNDDLVSGLSKIFSFIADGSSTGSGSEASPVVQKQEEDRITFVQHPREEERNNADKDNFGRVGTTAPIEDGHLNTAMGRYRFVLHHIASKSEEQWLNQFNHDAVYSLSSLSSQSLDGLKTAVITRFMTRNCRQSAHEPDCVPQKESMYNEAALSNPIFSSQFGAAVNASRQELRVCMPLELFFQFTWKNKQKFNDASEWRDRPVDTAILALLYFFLIVDTPCIIFSTLYPLVHFLYVGGFASLNILQTFCITVMFGCWAVIAMFSKRGLLYVGFVADTMHIPAPTNILNLDNSRKLVKNFFLPSPSQILLHSLDWNLVCPDVIGVAASFIASDGPANQVINTKSLRAAEACQLKSA